MSDPFATAVLQTLGAIVEITKYSELHTFGVITKRGR